MPKEVNPNNLKVMPHSYEAESSLLGCLLIDAGLASEILSDLSEDDFYSEQNRLVLKAMKNAYQQGKPVDYVTVLDALQTAKDDAKVGGLDYLSSLSQSIPSTASYKTYLSLVKRDSSRRKLIHAAQDISEKALSSEDAQECLATAEKLVYDIGVNNSRSSVVPISESLSEVIDKFSKYEQDKGMARGLYTGITGVDEILNGLHESDLVIIAARPGMGKTSLAMNIVEHAAIYENASCVVFSLEMSHQQLTQRMACSYARVPLSKALKGTMEPAEWGRIWQAESKLSSSKIFIDDTASIHPEEILSRCRRIKAKYGLDLIMVDYIGLMSGAKAARENRQNEIAEYSRQLKMIAKELNVPVLALSQLSRQVTARAAQGKGSEPELSDLRDSGAIEQDADVVMFIYDPSVSSDGGEALTGASLSNSRIIKIAKHRNGPQGKVEVKWIGEFVRFENMDYKPDAASNGKVYNSVPEEQEQDFVYGDDAFSDEVPPDLPPEEN